MPDQPVVVTSEQIDAMRFKAHKFWVDAYGDDGVQDKRSWSWGAYEGSVAMFAFMFNITPEEADVLIWQKLSPETIAWVQGGQLEKPHE